MTPTTLLTYDRTIRTTDIPIDPNLTNFGIGQPGMDILPLDVLREASAHRLAQPFNDYLQYGYMSGDGQFRIALADFLTRAGEPTSFESLFLTGGNSKTLELICSFFTKRGDTIFVEEPTYFLAFDIFRDFDLNVIGIEMDENGLRIDDLEEKLKQHQPAFIYTIPVFHNPTTVTLSAERRQKLIELSNQHNFLIVADEVYQQLYYGDPPPASFGSYIEQSDNILSLNTFSKILAPGLRLGWIKTAPKLHNRLFLSGAVNSGGSVNHFTSAIVRSALELRLTDRYLAYLIDLYRNRIDLMDSLIQTHFPADIHYQKPNGGYFFWLRLPEHVEAAAVRKAARERNVSFHPGTSFSPQQRFPNYMRLAFSFYGEEVTRQGMVRLGEVLHQFMPLGE